MKCKVCDRKLRVDNTIGVCRAHRSLSEKTQERLNKWKSENFAHLQQYKRRYAAANRKKLNATYVAWVNQPHNKAMHSLRVRLNKFLKGIRKDQGMNDLVGCSKEQLVKYLESKFQAGMTWENHGRDGWHIDHIIPLSKVNLADAEQLQKVAHYSNLQPLWAQQNIAKRNRIESSQECPTPQAGENVR